MTGVRDLEQLLERMEPVRRPGEFVFVTVAPDVELPALAMVREAEGVTLVVHREEADARHLEYDFIAAWITLQVHSALDAVGMTAIVATALAGAGISCNVLAGRFHDHLLVPHDRADDALRTLHDLATRR